MTDKELLELAAKAAGYTIEWDDASVWNPVIVNGDSEAYWNPLTSDSDALRLAVKLKMRISIDALPIGYVVVLSDSPISKDIHEEIDDPYAATRRAIVRAAAAIGQEMQ